MQPYRSILCIINFLFIFILFMPMTSALSATFTVDSTDDVIDVNPGDGVCNTAGGDCTLRAAVMESNALTGQDQINLPGGTYILDISGDNEDGALSGDLDITDDLIIVGGATIIDGNAQDRVLDIFENVSVNISGVTIRNGNVVGVSESENTGRHL